MSVVTVKHIVAALLAETGKRKCGQLPRIRGLDWAYVFMCSAELTRQFPTHSCTEETRQVCKHFQSSAESIENALMLVQQYDVRAHNMRIARAGTLFDVGGGDKPFGSVSPEIGNV
jgi:hypothetical protein